jgi:glycerophosphoryl diester phosphodiesterase
MRPLVISHAACGGHAPANTLAGIRKAIELGSDAIEIDLQASADDVPILMHDLTVDRSTDGSGKVAEMTLDQLKALSVTGEPIPTLSEVLHETKDKVLLIMEIKAPGIEEYLARVVHEHNALGQVMAWSFFPDALEGMRKAEPRIPCALLISPEHLSKWPSLKQMAIQMGLQGVSMFFAGIGEETARECRLSGLSLYTWTPDSETDIRRVIELGVDGVCTNYPDRVVAALGG